MKPWRGALCFIATLALAAPRFALCEGRALQHDPFARPSLGGLPQGAGSAPRTGPPRPVLEPKRTLNRQAVMVAGSASMANVDGVMVRVGDQVQGYRLVAVHDRGAVFEKDNKQFTVPLQGIKDK
jgi:hypothetical protein